MPASSDVDFYLQEPGRHYHWPNLLAQWVTGVLRGSGLTGYPPFGGCGEGAARIDCFRGGSSRLLRLRNDENNASPVYRGRNFYNRIYLR